MQARSELTRIALQPRESILLDGAAGTEVICREGRLWLTQYGDSRDTVLEPGQAFVMTLPSCLVMSTGGTAEFLLRPAPARPRRWLAGLFDPRWSSAPLRAMQGRMRVHHVA